MDEDSVIRHILAVTLNPDNAKGSVGDAPVIYLEGLAKVGASARPPPGAHTLRAHLLRAHASAWKHGVPT